MQPLKQVQNVLEVVGIVKHYPNQKFNIGYNLYIPRNFLLDSISPAFLFFDIPWLTMVIDDDDIVGSG